jgi:shikimate 5-dehydrogenase
VVILNRTFERARALVERFPSNQADLFHPDMLPEMDVVVQTTPVADRIPLSLDMGGLRKGARILETVMRDTALSREAGSRGYSLVPGHHMLYHQTGENFRLLTGVSAPDAIIRQAFAAAGLPLS